MPKTAGTTFTSILARQYKRKNIFDFTGDLFLDTQRFASFSEQDRSKVVLFTGHAPIFTGIPEADGATIITLLREPIGRVKSFCQHVSEGKSPYLLKEYPPESFDLDCFLASGNLELSNLQTHMLINNDINWGIPNLSRSETVAAALDCLYNKILCYGIQELFDQSLIVIAHSLNWRLPIYTSKNKKNTGRLINFEDRHIAKIIELNSIDIEVYQQAKKNLEHIIKSEKFNHKRLKRLQFTNKMVIDPLALILDKFSARASHANP